MEQGPCQPHASRSTSRRVGHGLFTGSAEINDARRLSLFAHLVVFGNCNAELLCRAQELGSGLVFGVVTLEIGLAPAGQGVPDMGCVVNWEVLFPLLVNVGKIARL